MPRPLSRRLFTRALTAAAAITAVPLVLSQVPAVHAAPEPLSPDVRPTPLDGALQIVVFEAPGCLHCNLFRRYVLPAYSASPRARDVPLRFLDLNEKDSANLGLDAPVDMVPTAVLLRNNREVGRIPGYVGPENFFHAVSHLLAVAEE